MSNTGWEPEVRKKPDGTYTIANFSLQDIERCRDILRSEVSRCTPAQRQQLLANMRSYDAKANALDLETGMAFCRHNLIKPGMSEEAAKFKWFTHFFRKWMIEYLEGLKASAPQ